jgi:hypothetical protein
MPTITSRPLNAATFCQPLGLLALVPLVLPLHASSPSGTIKEGSPFLSSAAASCSESGSPGVAGTGAARAASGGRATAELASGGRAWLLQHRNPKTSLWSTPKQHPGCGCQVGGEPQNSVGISGLAVLALLGDPDKYEAEIRASVAALLEGQAKDGALAPQIGHTFMYSHAIALLACLEAGKRLELEDQWHDPIERALKFLEEARNPYGAWRYDVPPMGENDTSVTVWGCLCVCAADDLGFKVSPASFMGPLRWLVEATDPANGRIGYNSKGSASARIAGFNDEYPTDATEAMTAAGLRAQYALGLNAEIMPAIGKSEALLLKTGTVAYVGEQKALDFYCLMHASAAFAVGEGLGKGAKAWGGSLMKVARDRVETKGCLGGSWAPRGVWAEKGGRTYSTAAMVLALEPLDQPIPRPRTTPVDLVNERKGRLDDLLEETRLHAGFPEAVSRTSRPGSKAKRSIEHGLNWLAEHQDFDGSWSDKAFAQACTSDQEGERCDGSGSYVGRSGQQVTTALALMAFMGAGHGPGHDGPFREQIDAGLQHLLEIKCPDVESDAMRRRWEMLTQLILPTLALIEARTFLECASLDSAVHEHLEALLASESEDGGWVQGTGRSYSNGSWNEEQIAGLPTALALLALHMGDRYGHVELGMDVRSRAKWALEKLMARSGDRAVNSLGEPDPLDVFASTNRDLLHGDAYTASVFLGKTIGSRKYQMPDKAILKRMLPKRLAWGYRDLDLMGWYVTTLSLGSSKGAASRKWGSVMEKAICENQVSKPRTACRFGSWDPVCVRNYSLGGRTYATATAILCLQAAMRIDLMEIE